MNLQLQYPSLWSFLAAWFPDADLEEMSDAEAAREFCKVTRAAEVRKVIEEGERALADMSSIWIEIGDEANRAFVDAANAERWLRSVLQEIRAAPEE